MQQDKKNLLPYAMHAGIYLGLFWVLKYFFIIGANKIPAFAFIDGVLKIGTLFLLFYFLQKYKLRQVEGKISYWHGVQFGIMLFFFASILEACIAYVHIAFIEPSYIAKLYDNIYELAEQLPFSERMIDQLKEQSLPSYFSYIFNNIILSNVFIGFILSLIVVPFVKDKKEQNADSPS